MHCTGERRDSIYNTNAYSATSQNQRDAASSQLARTTEIFLISKFSMLFDGKKLQIKLFFVAGKFSLGIIVLQIEYPSKSNLIQGLFKIDGTLTLIFAKSEST